MSIGVTFFFSVPKLTEVLKKKIKKLVLKTEQVEKKRSKGGQKLRLWVPPCVFIYENVIEL